MMEVLQSSWVVMGVGVLLVWAFVMLTLRRVPKPPLNPCAAHRAEEFAKLRAELAEALKYGAPMAGVKATVKRTVKCEHNEYWTTHGGGCMACRVVEAENENRTLRHDLARTTARLRLALDELRCPECGCGDAIDAESRECGCDAPLCAREGGQTLAAWALRMKAERDTALAKVERHGGFMPKPSA